MQNLPDHGQYAQDGAVARAAKLLRWAAIGVPASQENARAAAEALKQAQAEQGGDALNDAIKMLNHIGTGVVPSVAKCNEAEGQVRAWLQAQSQAQTQREHATQRGQRMVAA